MESSFGKNLKFFRENKGLTQEDVAEKCGVSATCVSRWETGAWRPKPRKQSMLAEILDVSVKDFYLTNGFGVDDSIIDQVVREMETMSEKEQELVLSMVKTVKQFQESEIKPV